MKSAELGKLKKLLVSMRHSPLHNYIVPGLTSSLLGSDELELGKFRLFEASRDQIETICPHSHRYDFTCIVMEGTVHNTIFDRISNYKPVGVTKFAVSKLSFDGVGKYVDRKFLSPSYFAPYTTKYDAGESYSMSSHEIHQIKFMSDAKVLFIEGPTLTQEFLQLHPLLNDGTIVENYEVKPWMFRK